MKEDKFYYLANDITFKYLFKNPKTRGFFEDIIKYYTDIDVSSFDFIDNEVNNGNGVSYRLDSILVNKDKSVILNVELNREYKDYISIRNRKYLHRIMGNTYSNKTYKDKIDVVQFNINCFYSKDNKDIATSTYMLRDIENGLVDEDFKIVNIFIPKIVNSCYTNDIAKKLKLFLCDSYQKLKELSSDEELKIIVSELGRLNKDKYFGALYDAKEEQELLEASAKEEGRLEGIEQGSLTKSKEIAKSMLSKNIDVETISECTGLSKEEIMSLKNK